MSQLRAAKRVCKNPSTKAYYLTKSCNDVQRREWLYRDGAARKVLGDRDFVFGDELTRETLLKIAVTSDELRVVNVYKVCVQPLDGAEFTVHVDVAACRISDLKSQIRAKNGMCPSEQLLYLMSSSSGSASPKPLFDGKDSIVSDCMVSLHHSPSTFGRGGILSENRKDGKVTVHSAKNISKFDSIVGRSANRTDQINLGIAAALRSNIYGGVPRATSLTTTVSGGPVADDCAYVEFKVDGSPSALSNSFIGAFQVPSSWPTFPAETLAPGDASPDFLDLFRPQHHCAVFNGGTPRYFMMHLLNGRLYGLDMDAHCHFPDCDCDFCPGPNNNLCDHDHDRPQRRVALENVDSGPYVSPGDHVGVYTKVGPRGFVRFFINGVEVGKGYRSREKAYRFCSACVTADAHDIHSHRRSRQFVLHGSIAPPLVVAVHTMLGDVRDHSSDVTYTIVPDADVPSVSEDDDSDFDEEDPQSRVPSTRTGYDPTKHAVLPNADFCGLCEGR